MSDNKPIYVIFLEVKMMNYDKVDLLDSSTIKALVKIYDLNYSHISFRLGFTRQNLVYLLKHDRFKKYQRELIYQLFKDYGMSDTDLVLIHHMIKKVNSK